MPPKKREGDRQKVMTPKQIRARARRGHGLEHVTKEEQTALLGKPLEDWDFEELAKGRPRDKNGNFTGLAPKWITREMHEKAMELFKDKVRQDMRSLTVKSMDVLEGVLDSDEVDEKGKPLVPANTKVDVAKFLIEHLIGKPTQPIEADISIKLQHVLGAALVMPADMENYQASSSHKVIEGSVVEDEEGGE